MSNFNYSCAILAGGEGRRMQGKDKGLLKYKGRYFIDWVTKAIPANCSEVLISCNRNHGFYQRYADKVIDDQPLINTGTTGHAGPMAGLIRVLQEVKEQKVMVLPVDTPCIEESFCQYFIDRANFTNALVNVVELNGLIQPLHLLMDKETLPSLLLSFNQGNRRVKTWLASVPAEAINCDRYMQQLKNINQPSDIPPL